LASINPTETTYIIVYVDDTFILSNSQANIDAVITNIGKHYEVILDRDAKSFLGLNLAHNDDGTVTITQPKLLTKLFALYPPRKKHTNTQAEPFLPARSQRFRPTATTNWPTPMPISASWRSSSTSPKAARTSWPPSPLPEPKAAAQQIRTSVT
jgi:hypothetical protein